MELKVLAYEFSICKVIDYSQIDLNQEYCFVSKTDEENSLVCPSFCVPGNTIERDDGWKAFRIQGILDFSLIGILSKISSLMAENSIGIFAVSTYNTDYVFIKTKDFDHALQILSENGYQII